jgi:hypothetical protein
MYKTIVLLKRKPGLTAAEFRAYYEGTHARLGESWLKGGALKYQRRYLHDKAHPAEGRSLAPEEGNPVIYDVVTEIWYRDEEQMEATWQILSAPENAAIMVEDEERFIDRRFIHMYTVREEYESDIL